MPEWTHLKFHQVQKNPLVEAHFHPEKQTPVRSIFASGYGRQCVPTKELAKETDAKRNSKTIYRIYQWDEDVSRQNYDKVPIAPKIGTIYS